MSNSKESASYSEDSISTSLSIIKKNDHQFYVKDEFMNLKILTDASEKLLSPENSMLMSPLPIFSPTKSPQIKKKYGENETKKELSYNHITPYENKTALENLIKIIKKTNWLLVSYRKLSI